MHRLIRLYKICSKIILPSGLVLTLLFLPSPARSASSRLPVDSSSDYLCYYGSWNNDNLFRAKDFDLVILEPSNISAAQIGELKRGHDGVAGTDDDVIVVGYVSIGEDHQGGRKGDGRGPCYWDYGTSSVAYANAGFASWYLDDANRDNKPDMNGSWGSYYVNAGDSSWRAFLKSSPAGTDNILLTKQCDGLFLDTIDTASPWYPWPYRWMVVQMSDLVGWLHATYPEKYLIANRGLFYFDPDLATAYQHSIRPYVDGVMFESYYKEGDRMSWCREERKTGSPMEKARLKSRTLNRAETSPRRLRAESSMLSCRSRVSGKTENFLISTNRRSASPPAGARASAFRSCRPA